MILKSTDDEGVRFKAVSQVLKLLTQKFEPEAVPSILGTKRNRLIQRITGCPDPYLNQKHLANLQALEMLPRMEAFIESQSPNERLRAASIVACLGNIIEFDVPDHCPDVEEVLAQVKEERFHVDDLNRFRSLLESRGEVLYLTDNVGEIVFDRLLVRELHRIGCRVTVCVKSGPCQSDALIGDAVEAGMNCEADRLITTGTDAVGVNLDEASEIFNKTYHEVDIIVAKGMGNWETLTEYAAPCPTLFLFRTKCEPVAASVGAPLKSNIAKLVPEGWHI